MSFDDGRTVLYFNRAPRPTDSSQATVIVAAIESE